MSENLKPSCSTDFLITGTFRSYVLSIRIWPWGVTMRKELRVLCHIVDVPHDFVRRERRSLIVV